MNDKNYNSVVSLKKCTSYDHAEEKIMGMIGDLNISHIFKNKRVLLKVNLMIADRPQKSTNTHPEFVRAVIRVVKKFGGTPSIGESSGAYGFTREAFKISGIEKVAFEERVKILNFDALPTIRSDINGVVLKEAYLPKVLKEVDILVSLPKLKTHRHLLYTGALKNQIGLLPGCHKVKLHLFSEDLETLGQAIADLNAYVKFDLAIMDGILAMEGNGPTSGRPINSNFVAASNDLVALDAVCCYMMGIEPKDVLSNIIAEQRGLGTCNLDKIKINVDLRNINRVHFEVPRYRGNTQKNKIYNSIYYKLRSNMIRPSPIIRLCNDCKQCHGICPTGAIISGRLPIDMKKCILCFACYENCPHGAIKLKCRWFLKPMFRKKLKNFILKDLL